MRIRRLFTLFALAGLNAVSNAEVVDISVDSTELLAHGARFGNAGQYRKIRGTIRFAVDPAQRQNANIADIAHAPVDGNGKVAFSTDYFLLRPEEMSNANGGLFFEVPNRGRKLANGRFNHGAANMDLAQAGDLGDGFLLNEGFTILWIGWQFDVPDHPDLLGLEAPVAIDGDGPVTGLARSDFVVREPRMSHSLGDRNHHPYPVADPDDPRNQLTVRDKPLAQRRTIPRDQWQFGKLVDRELVPSRSDVYLETGFEPHKIYEVVYLAEDAVLTGLGMAAIRDTISSFKHDGDAALGIAADDIDRAIAFGSSQSGRLLRTFLYDGFNADEMERKVFDGVIAHIAGGARGSFNHRFAQASRASWSYFYPGALFPFADTRLTDPHSGSEDGLLAGIEAAHRPKVFYTNSSNEYWRGTAALTHVTPDGRRDIADEPFVRRYLFAGTQHGPARFPPSKASGQHPGNPNDYSWFLRALLIALDQWITDDVSPPPSQHPTLETGKLVRLENLHFPDIPGVPVPTTLLGAVSLDFGSDFPNSKIITKEPPLVGEGYPVLLPAVDSDGNETSGLRSPVLAAPLATYTGWSLFDPKAGPPDELVSLQGSYIPLPRDVETAEATGDPRQPIDSRYASKRAYLDSVRRAAHDLAADRYLLEDDIPAIVRQAGAHWDYLMQ